MSFKIVRMSNYRQLLLLSTKALSTYDPESSGVDNHLEKFLQLPECSVSPRSHDVYEMVGSGLAGSP